MTSPHRFGSVGYQVNLKGVIEFEVRSLLGRVFSRRRPPQFPYLHIGCGPNELAGFQNMDFYSLRSLIRGGPASRVGHDLRYPLPYDSESFDGAFPEHTLEHLYPSEVMQLLSEIRRVLRRGAVFRCGVPDLRKYVDFYLGGNVSVEFSRFESGCQAIWSLTQNFGHRSVWDAPTMIMQMVSAGFKRAKEVSFREGENADLLVDKQERRWETLYVEAVC
jgi:hypothetical protein